MLPLHFEDLALITDTHAVVTANTGYLTHKMYTAARLAPG